MDTVIINAEKNGSKCRFSLSIHCNTSFSYNSPFSFNIKFPSPSSVFTFYIYSGSKNHKCQIATSGFLMMYGDSYQTYFSGTFSTNGTLTYSY